ncbi:hypothetical protein ACS127_14370 [Amphibacillus sp. Q70]|uniref:hypothetical protein n=1 Tax=Amphibacillus sp. Q70 TaxID=3453416 RepID=UPI003F832C1A
MLGLTNHLAEFILILVNQMSLGKAFQGIELLNAALIISVFIIVCLSYVLFRLYHASQSNKSSKKVKEKLHDHDHLE